jgi:chromosome segregation ATPase
MTLKLVVTTNVNGDVFELVLKNAKYGVGRRHDNDLRIKETYISGYHSELTRTEDGDYVLSDMGSSNGTFLNGRRIEGKEKIKAGDFIKFGILKVAVQEHTDTMPKIVSLKDRPAFARKEETNTAAIAVEKKTGPLIAAAAIEAKGETQSTSVSDGSKNRFTELETQFKQSQLKSADLEKEVQTLRRDLTERENELKSLADTAVAKVKVDEEVKTLRANLAHAEETAVEKDKEHARLRNELGSTSTTLSAKADEAGRLAGEIATLRSILTETESREQKARAEISAAVVNKDETIRRLDSQVKSLTEALSAKEGDLKATAKEAARISVLASELAALKSELDDTKSRVSSEVKEKSNLEASLSSKSAELNQLRTKIDELTAAAEKDKTYLAEEIETTKSLAEKERTAFEAKLDEKADELDLHRSEVKTLQAKIDALTAAAEKDKSGLTGELETTKSLAEKERASLEAKLAAQADELSSHRSEVKTLQAKIDALTAAAEKDKSGLTGELETTKSLAEKERASLEAKLAAQADELSSHRSEVKSLQTKIDALTAAAEKDKSGLAGELEAAKSLAGKERTSLEAELAGKADELDSHRAELKSLRTKIDALTADAEKDKSGLAGQLAAATLAAVTVKAEFSKLREESTAVRKERDQQLKELEKERAKLGKTIQTLEVNLASQTEQLSSLKSALAEKEKAVLSASSESKETAKKLAELDSVKTALESARAELTTLAKREEEARREVAETGKRLASVEAGVRAATREKDELNATLSSRLAAAESAAAEVTRLNTELENARLENSRITADSEKEISKWQDQIAALTATIALTDEQNTLNRRQLDEAQRLVGSSEIERASLRSELSEMQKRAALVGEESTGSRARVDALEAERDELKSLLKVQVNDLQAAKAEANDLRVDLKRTKEISESSLIKVEQALKARVAELETSLASERVLAGDTLSQKTALETDLGDLRKNEAALSEEISQLKARNEESSRNSGRLQAELNREAAERSQISEELASARSRAAELAKDVEDLREALSGKDRELAEREQQFTRSESETVQKLKRELGEAIVVRDAAEERSSKANKEKLSLSGAYERLKEQLDLAEEANRKAKEAEEDHNHSKGLLARRLEKAEASNSELAARIKEEALALIANRDLIGKLEQQLRENESDAVRREQEQIVALRADLGQMKRRSSDEERQRNDLETELSRTREAKRLAEERLLELNERLLERESETISTRTLLTETEKKRGDLSSLLAEESALAATQAKALEALRKDLADTIVRFKASESDLLTKHGDEIDSLLAELRSERAHKEGLEIELSNTRVGMSNALRQARDESAAAQARLIAEGNAKLSAVEDTLSEAIRAREEIEQSRSEIEDELNQRDAHIEKLSERIEDLEIHWRDEIEARHAVLRDLKTTREGFSTALYANWGHLGTARQDHEKERSARGKFEESLSAAREDIASLNATIEEQEQRYRADIREWEDRYDALREEKLTLASEDANLNKIREQIIEATAKRRQIEDELDKLGTGMKEFLSRHRELQTQKDALLGEREELKAGLNVARSELDSVQRRCNESKEQESKLADTITAAERRIQSLRKLELEMEQAVERKRQQHVLNRGDVFSEQLEALTPAPEFSQEEFYRKLIAKLDLLDDLTKRYDNKWRYPKVAEQLGILKRSFVDFLQDHSVRQFDLEPGTVLSVAERKRIKLVPLQNGAAKKPVSNGAATTSQVVETLRPGYVYRNGSKDVIIRKAEVVVS